MGKRQKNRPHATIFKLNNFKDKLIILHNAKKLDGIYIYEHFCDDPLTQRKSLWCKVIKYPRQSKIAYLYYGSIVVRDKS